MNKMKKIVPAVEDVIPRLVQSIRFHLGEASVSKIVLYGSAIDAGSFREGESDLDVAVILMPDALINDFNAFKQIEVIKAEVTGVWRRLDIHLHKSGSLERLANYELCFQGRVCQGITLFDAAHVPVVLTEVLNRDDARDEICRGHLKLAMAKLMTMMSLDSAAWSYCRAICSVFHALLIVKDVDLSPKSIRWNLDALLAETVKHYPNLAKLKKYIDVLPKNLAQQDIDDYEYKLMMGDVESDFSIKEKRQMLAVLLLCLNAAQSELGNELFPVTHWHKTRKYSRVFARKMERLLDTNFKEDFT